MRRIAALALLAVLTLGGCAPAAPEPEATPTPTVPSATPEQVASVLAEYETDWRETIDQSGDCRFIWVLGTSLADEMKGMTCYLREQTIGLTAQIVIRDWSTMAIPDSMAKLVDDTREVLDQIGKIDLKANCGSDAVPSDEDVCNAALGARNGLYGQLEGKLDAWGPYL